MRLIDADALIEKCGDWYVEEGTESGFIGTLKNLLVTMPTIQTVATDTNVGDTIYREDALMCLTGEYPADFKDDELIAKFIRRIRALSPAPPEEHTEKRTETHACDLISRQAAVELAMKYCPDDDGAVQCDGDIRGLLDELENLPPAQPEPERTMEEFMYGQDMGNPEDGSL